MRKFTIRFINDAHNQISNKIVRAENWTITDSGFLRFYARVGNTVALISAKMVLDIDVMEIEA